MKLATTQSTDRPGTFTALQLAEIVGVPVADVERWVSHGLLTPCTSNPESSFDFRQLSLAQSLKSLAASGANLKKLKQAMKRIGKVSPATSTPMIRQDGNVFARLNDGELLDTDNQLHIEFASEIESVRIHQPASRTSDDCYSCGVQHEVDGRLELAIDCYREALLAGGPDKEICFALAHALAAIGSSEAAVERYRQVLELDPLQAEAWNNLGVELCNLQRWPEACDAIRKGLELRPDDAGKTFNLADALDEAGDVSNAAEIWRRYLTLDRTSERAAYARRRLAAS